jgi:hypothetical protein
VMAHELMHVADQHLNLRDRGLAWAIRRNSRRML